MIENLKLRDKMLIFVLGINLVMLFAVFGVYYTFSRKLVVNETQQRATEKVREVIATLDGYLKEKSKIAWTFSQQPIIKRWLETNKRKIVDRRTDPVYGQIIDYFKSLVKNDGEIYTAFLASERLQWYWDSDEVHLPEDYQVGKRQWYINVVKLGKPCFDVDTDIVDKSVRVNYRYPIYSDKGKLLGVGGIDISLDSFKKLMSELASVFNTGQVFLVGKDGTFLYHPDENLVLKKKLSDFKDDGKHYKNLDIVNGKILNGDSGIDEVVFNGEKRYFMYRPVPKLGWTLVLSVAASEVNAPLKILARTSALIIILALIFLVVVIILLTDTITKPINKLVYMLKDIAEGEGNLTKRIRFQRKDEVGELARWFNIFVDKLYEIVIKVKSNAEEVAGAANEISATSAQLAAGAEEQSTQASEVATSVQEMTAAIVRNSENAKQTSRISEDASLKAQEGRETIQIMHHGMEEIVTVADKAGEIINSLSGRAEQIGEVISLIDEIADQTNLLALNATIEAANAGEQGRGFSVVADEIRNLAERTTAAIHEITKTIETIQNETQEASKSMDEVHKVVADGEKAVERVEDVLKDIIQSVSEATSMIQQIAAVSEEQSTGAEEISNSVTAISAVTKQSANGAQQLASTVQNLNRQTEALKSLVEEFTLDENEH